MHQRESGYILVKIRTSLDDSCRIVTCKDVDQVQSSDSGPLSLQPLNDAKTMDEIQEAQLRTWLLPTSDNLYNLEYYS